MRVAAAVAVATAGILAAREEIHGWVARITWPELRSAVVLLAMTFIVLPIVPDKAIGPFGGVNPREIWLIAIVLAGVSFVGYVGVRVLGARQGILVAGAAGGLASSTAVTITNARHAAAGEATPALLAGGVALATAVSFLRVIAIIAVLQSTLLSLACACAARCHCGRYCTQPPVVARPNRTQQAYSTIRISESVWLLVGHRICHFSRDHCCCRPGDQRARGRDWCDRRRRRHGTCRCRRYYGFDGEARAADLVDAERGVRDLGGGSNQYAEQTDDRHNYRKQPFCALSRRDNGGLLRGGRDSAMADGSVWLRLRVRLTFPR